VAAAIAGGLDVILCVGELLAQREADRTKAVLDSHMEGGLAQIKEEALDHIVIAYEPVWAIGTGRTATPAQAQESHLHLRKWVESRYNSRRSTRLRILYGGSVKADNALELMSQPDVDGALVGGASLKADSFLAIVDAAAKAPLQ
jgi:triosephosphate isomerase (TIM)